MLPRFSGQYHNDDGCELWARQVKFEAAELFELVSRVVTKWVYDLVLKAIDSSECETFLFYNCFVQFVWISISWRH